MKFVCFSHNLNYALGWMVVHSLWQAMLIAIVSGIVLIAMRQKSAKSRYLVANMALLSVLLAAIATFLMYYDFNLNANSVIFVPETPIPNNDITNISEEIAYNAPPLSIAWFKAYFNEHLPLIVTIWAVGVAIFMLRLLNGVSYVYYLRSRRNFPADEYWQETKDILAQKIGLKGSIDLVESALVRTPMVAGHLKPIILFPVGVLNRLSTSEVEAILAHELAHIMRKDYLFNILQSVVESLFYFHPAVWWLSAQIRNERENIADDMAIAVCGSKMHYAKALVSLQEQSFAAAFAPTVGFAGQGKKQLLHRIQRILNQGTHKINIFEKIVTTCVLVLVFLSLAFVEKAPNFINNTPPLSIDDTEILNSNSNNNNTAHIVTEIDSLPNGEVKNGVYNYADNSIKAHLEVKNNKITVFEVNGKKVPAAEYGNHRALIRKLTGASNTPSPPTPPPTPNYNQGYNQNYNQNNDYNNGNIGYYSNNNDDDAGGVVTIMRDNYIEKRYPSGKVVVTVPNRIETRNTDGSKTVVENGQVWVYDKTGKLTSHVVNNQTTNGNFLSYNNINAQCEPESKTDVDDLSANVAELLENIDEFSQDGENEAMNRALERLAIKAENLQNNIANSRPARPEQWQKELVNISYQFADLKKRHSDMSQNMAERAKQSPREADLRQHFNGALDNTLKGEGLIRNGQSYNWQWSAAGFYLNGRKLSAAQEARYLKIYESIFGRKPSPNFNMTHLQD